MALLEVFSIHKTPNQITLAEDRMLPATLRDTSFLTGILCLFALGRPDLEAHWESLQSEEAFKNARERLCSILTNTITAAGLLLATSGVFVTTVSPVPYFDYNLPAPYFLLFISLMMAMIAMLISGLSIMRWLHADRQYTQEQIKPGGYFLLTYLLSMVMPMFFVGLSLNCFIFAILIAGFYSQSTVSRTITAVWLVTYVASVGLMTVEFMWRLAKYLKSL